MEFGTEFDTRANELFRHLLSINIPYDDRMVRDEFFNERIDKLVDIAKEKYAKCKLRIETLDTLDAYLIAFIFTYISLTNLGPNLKKVCEKYYRLTHKNLTSEQKKLFVADINYAMICLTQELTTEKSPVFDFSEESKDAFLSSMKYLHKDLERKIDKLSGKMEVLQMDGITDQRLDYDLKVLDVLENIISVRNIDLLFEELMPYNGTSNYTAVSKILDDYKKMAINEMKGNQNRMFLQYLSFIDSLKTPSNAAQEITVFGGTRRKRRRKSRRSK